MQIHGGLHMHAGVLYLLWWKHRDVVSCTTSISGNLAITLQCGQQQRF